MINTIAVVFLMVLSSGYAGEVTVDDLFTEARSQTEPFFRGNLNAEEMTITESVYKETPQGDLFTRVYAPAHLVPGKKYPCAVFFCGGGWINGTLLQFGKHCEYLVSKGFIAMTPQYRMQELHGTTPREAAEDAISCIRWVREHAEELNIDPDRILVGGGSAGGHLAAAAATLTEIYSTNDHLAVSCRPNLLALFNPVVNTGPDTPHIDLVADYWEEFSPSHNIKQSMPDTVIFHGLEDGSVPVWTVRDFASRLADVGSDCRLYLYPGQNHGFFNGGDGDQPYFYDTMYRMGLFLEDEGWIESVDSVSKTIYQEEFYIDGAVRIENMALNGSAVGLDVNSVGEGPYSWAVTLADGFYTKYNRPGGDTIGNGGVYYSQLAGAYSYATINFNEFSDYSSLTLTAEANALDCSPLRMGFGVDTMNSFESESADAVYIQSSGGGVLNAEVDVSLVIRHDGHTVVLETLTGADRLAAVDDIFTLQFNCEHNRVTAGFKNGDDGIAQPFAVHTLDFVPDFSCVKYEIQNEGSFGNSNFPRWENTSLRGTLPAQ